MINYFLKVTICWGLFYLIYTLFLSKETFFKINRWYLLGTLILGLIIPIIPIDLLYYFSSQPTTAVPYIHPIVEPIVTQVQIVDTVIAVQTAKEEIRYGLLLLWLIYAIGVCVKLSKFGNGLRKIYKLYQAGTVHQKGNYKLVLTKEIHLPFSFFNYLFWSQGTHIEEKDAGTIITHEVAHINQWHSIDTLLLEWLSVWLWFSPPIYWYKKSLKDIHEYLADACVLKDTKTKQYGQLLLKQAQSSMQLALASHFLDSQLKKRILMMTKNQSSKQALMKYLSALPLLVLMIMVFSNPQVRANLNATAQLSIDYLNPNVKVPNVPASLLLWIGGDFDREKAKKVLEAAYACEGVVVTHLITIASGEQKIVEKEGDRIKELHKAAIFLVRKFPLHLNEIHELAIEVAKEEGYALRFHEDGESIIYRELNPTKKKEGMVIFFEEDTDNTVWDDKLLLLNDEVVGPVSEHLNALGDFSIHTSDIKYISSEDAVKRFGEELGKNGAVNFYTDQFRVVEEGDKKVLEHFTSSIIKDDFLVLFNDSVMGMGPEILSNLSDFSNSDLSYLSPIEAIKKYGEELGKNGAMSLSSTEFIVVEENGKKVVRQVLDMENAVYLIINGTVIGNIPISALVPEVAISSKKNLKREDVFMRGHFMPGYTGEQEVVDIILTRDYVLVQDAWGIYNILPKEASLSEHYSDHRLLFSKVDQMPILKDCATDRNHSEQKNCTYINLSKFIYQNIKYPVAAREKNIEGTVKMRFTIDKDGTMTDMVITESVKGLDDAVNSVFNLLVKENWSWIPGQQNGEMVKVVKDVPITFKIEGDNAYSIKIMKYGRIKKIEEGVADTSIPVTKSLLNITTIFPNPATDHIRVAITNEDKSNADPIQLKVITLDGKEIHQEEIDGSTRTQLVKVNLQDDVKGMVIVTLTRGEYSVERKVMVQ